MAQFGRPSTDASIGGYQDQAGGTTNIFGTIDETSASDADYVRSVVAPVNAPYVTRLTTLEDPLSSSGHTIRWRRQKNAAGGATVNLTVQLRQTYVNEGSPGTLIAEKATVAVPDSWTDDSLTLSGGEADAITDYTALYLRFVANQP
jgi:hypothetical protein